jgi:rod shape-determining protein MreD
MIIIVLTLFVGLMLSLMMLPLGYIAPEWLLLINIYWAIALPSNKKIFLAFISGFFVDIVLGQPLGISSLSYVIFIYIILSLYNALRYMTIPQQMIVIFFFDNSETAFLYLDFLCFWLKYRLSISYNQFIYNWCIMANYIFLVKIYTKKVPYR